MFFLCFFPCVQNLEIAYKVLDVRNIQEFADDVRRLAKAYGERVLFDCPWEVVLAVKVVSMHFADLSE